MWQEKNNSIEEVSMFVLAPERPDENGMTCCDRHLVPPATICTNLVNYVNEFIRKITDKGVNKNKRMPISPTTLSLY